MISTGQEQATLLPLHRIPSLSQLESGWSNADNSMFYENISLEAQKNFAVLAGLNDHADLREIHDLIEPANSILEVGACYGRVLEYLQQFKSLHDVEVIERSSKFHQYLLTQYENALIHHSGVLQFNTDKKFDLILWLWSGITDFAPYEQQAIIEKFYNLLSENGKLVVETCPHSHKVPSQLLFHNNFYYIEREQCSLFGYIPTPEKFAEYNRLVSKKSIAHKQYKTATGLKREIYIISK
jgi:phospholipid N-methyltransferase